MTYAHVKHRRAHTLLVSRPVYQGEDVDGKEMNLNLPDFTFIRRIQTQTKLIGAVRDSGPLQFSTVHGDLISVKS